MKNFIASFTVCICMCALSGSAQTRTVETKTGWSQKKKATVIGAAVGAGTGAIVSKRKARGAVIGGVVGAGAGYAYGTELTDSIALWTITFLGNEYLSTLPKLLLKSSHYSTIGRLSPCSFAQSMAMS